MDLCEIEIRAHAQQSEEAQRIEAIIGVGPMTASAVAVTVTNARDFKNGRQMAAWLGLVPKQFSSGGKTSLGKIKQTWGRVSAGAADRRSTLGAHSRLEKVARETHAIAALDDRGALTARVLQNSSGHRQQTRADDLGHPRQGRGVRPGGLEALHAPSRLNAQHRIDLLFSS
jgi:hypothetical protein